MNCVFLHVGWINYKWSEVFITMLVIIKLKLCNLLICKVSIIILI